MSWPPKKPRENSLISIPLLFLIGALWMPAYAFVIGVALSLLGEPGPHWFKKEPPKIAHPPVSGEGVWYNTPPERKQNKHHEKEIEVR